MKRKRIVSTCVLAVMLLAALPAQAITFGEPDGNRHPNVGLMIVQFPDGSLRPECSGTLIAPTIFLTAAHCTSDLGSLGIAPHDTWVTFDPVFSADSTLYPGTYFVNEDFGSNGVTGSDVAVVVLDAPVSDITPARLPEAGLLDQMMSEGTLQDTRFVTVGYGFVRADKTGGPHSLQDNTERRYTEQFFLSLTPAWVHFSMNPATGSGGSCYGDSGGPHFLDDSDVVVAVTSRGDTTCRALDVGYRLDTEAARAYLGQFVDLP